MSGKPWYETRKKFRGDYEMIDRARRLDANLRRFYEGRSDWPSTAYSFPRVDLGRVTWSRGYEVMEPAFRYFTSDWSSDEERYVPTEKEGFIVPASATVVPDFAHDAIPLHLTTLSASDLVDRIIGCEDFGGGRCETTVYFAEGQISGLIKIGLATNSASRLSSIRTSSSEPVFLLAEFEANRLFERFLHGLFEPLRHHGEWFFPHWSVFNVASGATM